MELTILSSPLILEAGTFKVEHISLEEAKRLVDTASAVHNHCGHQTVKLLGLPPVKGRPAADGYEVALAIKPGKRLEFGREYSLEEIEEIGYTIFKISKVE